MATLRRLRRAARLIVSGVGRLSSCRPPRSRNQSPPPPPPSSVHCFHCVPSARARQLIIVRPARASLLWWRVRPAGRPKPAYSGPSCDLQQPVARAYGGGVSAVAPRSRPAVSGLRRPFTGAPAVLLLARRWSWRSGGAGAPVELVRRWNGLEGPACASARRPASARAAPAGPEGRHHSRPAATAGSCAGSQTARNPGTGLE